MSKYTTTIPASQTENYGTHGLARVRIGTSTPIMAGTYQIDTTTLEETAHIKHFRVRQHPDAPIVLFFAKDNDVPRKAAHVPEGKVLAGLDIIVRNSHPLRGYDVEIAPNYEEKIDIKPSQITS